MKKLIGIILIANLVCFFMFLSIPSHEWISITKISFAATIVSIVCGLLVLGIEFLKGQSK